MNIKVFLKSAAFLAVCFAFVTVPEAYGQYCVGYTKYTIQKPDGSVLKTKDLRHLDFAEFDGQRRDVQFRYGKLKVNYEIGGKVRNHTIAYEDEVAIYFGYCGQIGEIKLEYMDINMKLIFNVGINNANYSIEALPFQEGTFKLTSLKCDNGKNPPRIDNENFGFCTIPSGNWKKVSAPVSLEN